LFSALCVLLHLHICPVNAPPFGQLKVGVIGVVDVVAEDGVVVDPVELEAVVVLPAVF
jgi:hypothetical protein